MPLFGPPNINKLEEKGNVEALIKELKHNDSQIHDRNDLNRRCEAASALGRLRDPRAIEALLACFQRFQSHTPLGKESAKALLAIGKPAVEPLIRSLRTHNDVATLLGEIGDVRAVQPLIARLKTLSESDSSGQMYERETIAHALAQIGAPAVEALADGLRDKVGLSRFRYSLIKALEGIGSAQAAEAITLALDDSSSFNRKNAAAALEHLGWQPTSEVQEAVYLIAAGKMQEAGALDAPAVEPLLVVLLHSDAGGNTSDLEAMERAARALGKTRDARVIEPLITSLQSGLRGAAEGLGQTGGSRAREALVAALVQPYSEKVRSEVAEALDSMGWTPESAEQKANYLVAAQRWEECVKLGAAAVEPLVRLLSRDFHTFESTKVKVMKALAQIGDSRAVEPIIGVLKAAPISASSKLISETAEALVYFKDDEDRIVKALVDKLQKVQLESQRGMVYSNFMQDITKALRQIGTPLALRALEPVEQKR